MLPWRILGEARAPDGAALTLHERNGEFCIRAGGRELMSTSSHDSERALAELAIASLPGAAPPPRILIGGLGLGYTLRAALDALPQNARVVVAELVPAVIEWNRGPLAALAGRPLDDPRAEVVFGDVRALVAEGGWSAILYDVDNGPQPMTRAANARLYDDAGLAAARAALIPGGVLAVWSADPDRAFAARLTRAGFRARAVEVAARAGRGARHTIFLAALP